MVGIVSVPIQVHCVALAGKRCSHVKDFRVQSSGCMRGFDHFLPVMLTSLPFSSNGGKADD